MFTLIFIYYLAVLSISWGMGESLVFTATWGIQFSDQGSNLGPCIGSSQSQPLDDQESIIFKFQIFDLSEYIWVFSRLLHVPTDSSF